MSLLVRSGLVSGTTGTTLNVTNCGFRPVGLILWLNATGTGIGSCVHVWADGGVGYSRWGYSKTASATTVTGGGTQIGIMVPSSTGTVSHTGTVTSTSTGFSITWGATGTATAFQMAWQAIGGGYVWASTFLVSTLSGIAAGTKRLSVRPSNTKAWTPIAGLLFPAQSGGANYGIGAISNSGGLQQWSATSFCKTGSDSGNTQQAWYAKTSGTSDTNDGCLSYIDASMSLVTKASGAMVLGGIDLTFTKIPATPSNYSFIGMVIGGADPATNVPTYEAEALSVVKSSATAPVTTVLPSTSTRDARFLMMASTRATSTGPSAGMTLAVGGATTQSGVTGAGIEGTWSATLVDRDAVGSSSASAAIESTKVLRLPSLSGSVTYPVDISANLESTNVTLTLNPNDTRLDRLGYLRLSQTQTAASLTLLTPSTCIVTTRADLTAVVTPNMTNVTTPAQIVATVSAALRESPGLIATTSTAAVETQAWAFGPIVSAASTVSLTVTAAASRMGDAKPVAAEATLAVTASGVLGINYRMTSQTVSAVNSSGTLQYVLPTITDAVAGEMQGTVNLVADPGYESGTLWSGVNGATIAASATVWHGTRSAAATFNGGTLRIATPSALAINAGAFVGSFFIYNPSALMQSRLVLTHTNGSVVTGAWSSALTGSGWIRVTTPAVTSNTGTTVDSARLEISGGTSVIVDGVQIERGTTPTAWCSGALGSPAGVWLGGVNASPSYRLTQTMQSRVTGSGGHVRVSARLYRANYQNVMLQDLSDYIISGEVTWARDAEVTWALSCSITGDGWAELTPYLDWVAPVLRVEYPDGTVSEDQLGLYLVMDSPETHTESGVVIDLRAFDPCYLLRMQGFSGPVIASGSKIGAVRDIIDGAVLTGGDKIPKRYDIPSLPQSRQQDFRRRREWSSDENRLSVVNDILFGAGCSSLYCTNTGVLTMRRRAVERLKDSAPYHVWSAYDGGDSSSDVLDVVTTDPMTDDRENEIVIVSDGAGDGSKHVYVKGRYAKGQGGRPDAVDQTRRKARRVRHPMVQDKATALDVAEVLLEELGLRNESVTLTVLPDPELLAQLPWKVVGLAIWNASGEPVATGLHVVDGLRIGFTTDDATAEVTLLRVSMLSTEIAQQEGS